jgi:CRP-like cAMP-binding protein
VDWDADVRAAIGASPLSGLDTTQIDRLLAGATRQRVAAGAILRGAGVDGPHVDVIVAGLIRIEVSAPDGRSLTVRYARPGDVLGIVSLFRPRFTTPGSIHALLDSDVLTLRPDVITRMAATDLSVARVLLEELSERVLGFFAEIPGSAFTTVRQRVARHLLDVASDAQHGPELVARIRQQQLADAVGTVREVVVRVLRDLRAEGIVATGSGSINVLDPARLLAETYAGRAELAGT